jgi:hypothetical protein
MKYSDFCNDAPMQCAWCDADIEAGKEYLEYNGKAFCNSDCVKNHLFSSAKVTLKHINTAEDNYGNYCDEEYERSVALSGK